ncbi:MAG: hypothetical protein H6509_07575 [Bryobacterales bacterium]|nr:hypothetical protein [Bryobacterales bacterium]
MSRNSFLIGLIGVVALFWWVAASRYDAAAFGASHDDTLYFTAAKSISEGHGSRLESMPGEPPQTKYPALYPALLSLAWTINPEFPSNLELAWKLNLLFAALATLLAAALARQLGAGRGEALALAALTGLHPIYIYWADQLVSDLAFMAFGLGAAVLAERELRRERPSWIAWTGVVVLLVLACWTRTLGAAFVAGVAVMAMLRGSTAKAAAALAGAAPVAWGLWSAMSGDAQAQDAALALPGFEQNVAYYASYIAHWRQSVPDSAVLLAQVKSALTETLKHPAIAVFHLPAVGFTSMPMALVSIAISAGVINGVVARARRNGLHPVHVAALFYLPIVLLWNYLLMERFWLPFLPLFFAGASFELQRIAEMARASWRKGPAGDRVVVAGFSAALVALVAFGLYRGFASKPEMLARSLAARHALIEPKLEAYQWLRVHSSPSDTVISYDDGALYLYAHRRGMRAFSPLTDSFFAQDESKLERDLDGITDTAAALGARYWVTAPDDFEMTHAPEQIRKRMDKELATAPVVFASTDGRVRVHDISAMPWSRAAELRSGDTRSGLK